jgi:hypothetical protein
VATSDFGDELEEGDEGDKVEEEGKEPADDRDRDAVQEVRGTYHPQSHQMNNINLSLTV